MGVALAQRFAAVNSWFEQAEEASGLPLRRILREGPEEKLRLTEILQPALLTVEIGVWLALRELAEVRVVASLGHSLGEYAALVAAGALAPAAAVHLVRRRGFYMQEAVPAGLGGMSAVLGLDAPIVEHHCRNASDDSARVWSSNDNCPGQVVISGHLAAIERVTTPLQQAGARRVSPLKVSAPFHCPLMKPVADRLAADLEGVRFAAPAWPVIANFNAAPYPSAGDIRDGLLQQVVAPVRFRESLALLPSLGAVKLLELGPGTVLTGLAKRTVPDRPIFAADNPEKLNDLVREIA